MVLGNPPTIWKIRQRFHYHQSLIHSRNTPWVPAMRQTLSTDCPWVTYILVDADAFQWLKTEFSNPSPSSRWSPYLSPITSPAPRELPLTSCTSTNRTPSSFTPLLLGTLLCSPHFYHLLWEISSTLLFLPHRFRPAFLCALRTSCTCLPYSTSHFMSELFVYVTLDYSFL